jgi:hypothetical protein
MLTVNYLMQRLSAHLGGLALCGEEALEAVHGVVERPHLPRHDTLTPASCPRHVRGHFHTINVGHSITQTHRHIHRHTPSRDYIHPHPEHIHRYASLLPRQAHTLGALMVGLLTAGRHPAEEVEVEAVRNSPSSVSEGASWLVDFLQNRRASHAGGLRVPHIVVPKTCGGGEGGVGSGSW